GAGKACEVGLAYLDATTGELAATELPIGAVLDELVRVAPREVLVAGSDLRDVAPLAPIRARHRAMGAAWNPAAIPSLADARRELATIVVAGAVIGAAVQGAGSGCVGDATGWAGARSVHGAGGGQGSAVESQRVGGGHGSLADGADVIGGVQGAGGRGSA